MILGAAFSDPTTSGTLTNCDLWAIDGAAGGPLNIKSATLNNCRVGKLVQGTYSNFSNFEESTFNDCFINTRLQTYLNTQINNCYGFLTIRPRGPVTDTLSLSHCAFKPFTGNPLVLFNFHADPNDVGGSVSIVDSILAGDFDLSGNATRIGYVNDNWTLDYLNYHNYSLGGADAPPNAQTTDPLLVNPTTENVEDWYVASNSPCVAAASDGGAIGVGVAN